MDEDCFQRVGAGSQRSLITRNYLRRTTWKQPSIGGRAYIPPNAHDHTIKNNVYKDNVRGVAKKGLKTFTFMQAVAYWQLIVTTESYSEAHQRRWKRPQ